MPIRDPHQTISALLRMTVDRGCTPHEAATAKERAKAIAERLGLTLEAFAAKPDGLDWARAAETKSRARNATYEAQQRADAKAKSYARAREIERWCHLQFSLSWLAETIYDYETAGADLDTLVKRFGLEPHTIRAMICRLRKAGVPIASIKRGRKTFYRYGPD